MNKEKSQFLPNRQEWRASMRRFKHLRVAKKAKTKGAFGQLSEYMREIKKKSDLKKAEKMKLKNVKFTKPVETKEVKKEKTQPVVTKEVKTDTQPVVTKEVKEKTDE